MMVKSKLQTVLSFFSPTINITHAYTSRNGQERHSITKDKWDRNYKRINQSHWVIILIKYSTHHEMFHSSMKFSAKMTLFLTILMCSKNNAQSFLLGLIIFWGSKICCLLLYHKRQSHPEAISWDQSMNWYFPVKFKVIFIKDTIYFKYNN